MDTINKLESQIDAQAGARLWSAALVDALGAPAEWSFTGRVHDCGEGCTQRLDPPRCACGHPIRFCFIVTHPTKGETQVGSECINYFQAAASIHAALLEAEATLQQQIAEARRKAERAAADQLAAGATTRYKDALALAQARYRELAPRAPRRLWELVQSNKWRLPSEPPEYQAAKRIVTWCERKISELQDAMQDQV